MFSAFTITSAIGYCIGIIISYRFKSILVIGNFNCIIAFFANRQSHCRSFIYKIEIVIILYIAHVIFYIRIFIYQIDNLIQNIFKANAFFICHIIHKRRTEWERVYFTFYTRHYNIGIRIRRSNTLIYQIRFIKRNIHCRNVIILFRIRDKRFFRNICTTNI